MFKKISLVAVTAAAVTLALASCVKAPVSPVTPNLTGTWVFTTAPVVAMIDGSTGSVMVTVGTGQLPLGMEGDLALVTQVVANATLTEDAEENTFMLTLAGDDAVTVTLRADAAAAPGAALTQRAAEAFIAGIIAEAQSGTVMIDLDTTQPRYTMTVQGSFIEKLLAAAGLPPQPMGLMAYRDVEREVAQ